MELTAAGPAAAEAAADSEAVLDGVNRRRPGGVDWAGFVDGAKRRRAGVVQRPGWAKLRRTGFVQRPFVVESAKLRRWRRRRPGFIG